MAASAIWQAIWRLRLHVDVYGLQATSFSVRQGFGPKPTSFGLGGVSAFRGESGHGADSLSLPSLTRTGSRLFEEAISAVPMLARGSSQTCAGRNRQTGVTTMFPSISLGYMRKQT
jgi:hypothetical protein